jgi:hypothetical protein
MAKSRISIPKETKEKILKEFNHRCAICGSDNPHLHHIDENPTNNEIENLIPLCPNHHLGDQHNPTSAISFYKMKLFREYKDPTILSPKFHPLFERIEYLNYIDSISHKELIDKSRELVEFVSFLNMGGFYKDEIRKLVRFAEVVALTNDSERDDLAYKIKYKNKLTNNRKIVFKLVVELLRYQNWI